MPKFTDADGREWLVDLTLPDVRRVKKELDVDLLDEQRDVYVRLIDSTETLVDVISVLLTDQIKERQLDAVGFAKALRTEAVLDAATEALLEGIVAFSPRRRRAALQSLLKKTQTYMETTGHHAKTLIESDRADKVMTTMLDKMEREFETRLKEEADSLSGKPLKSGSPSPDSDPTPE